LTVRDQLNYLIVYSLAALFLLIRFHAYDERILWMRHRIGDAAALGGLYLRGGTVFVGSAVVIAMILTTAASSNPLAPLWKGVDQRLIDVGREFQRIFPGGGQGTRIPVVDFAGTATITGVWSTNNDPVMTIRVPDDGRYYWRAVVYDRFDGRRWTWSRPSEQSVTADDALPLGSDDPKDFAARHDVTFRVHEYDQYDPRAIFSPDTPTSVSVDSKLTTVDKTDGGPDFLAGLSADAKDYDVTASVFIDYDIDKAAGLTGNRLKAAGTSYPPGLLDQYTAYDPILVGKDTRDLMAAILAKHPGVDKNPYDLSRAIVDYLIYEGGFSYSADVTGIDCGSRLVVDCFAWSKQGYCEYYASTMALLLRMNHVPARLAEGFQPSDRDGGGNETVRRSASHAWVEVYFPGYGWFPFDPTGGSVRHDVPLPAGPTVSAAPATPRTSLPPDPGDPRRSIRPTAAAAAGTTDGRGGFGGGTLIVVGVLLAVIVVGLAFLAWQRGPRAASEPDVVWRSVVGLARRLGFAPRPSQTVFEYTSSLGEVLPNARPDLQTVARAKVEVAYGRGELGDDRLRSLRDAQRRLRVALLALIFRRRERRERRHRR
ncbi:MAG TPA: transglutaminaseTgpA domain-containing protein, partial [Patescibacteria group bacterium]|nr:transglutaminaseTgpA domain-containing protein [Patescibacteria group bacterium]